MENRVFHSPIGSPRRKTRHFVRIYSNIQYSVTPVFSHYFSPPCLDDPKSRRSERRHLCHRDPGIRCIQQFRIRGIPISHRSRNRLSSGRFLKRIITQHIMELVWIPGDGRRTGFRNSWMITGSLGVGWEFLLTADRDAQIALIPYVGVGFYTRSLTWFESTVRQSRPIVLTAVDAVLRTDNSLIFGTCLQLTGYMDRQDVWGLAVVLSAGYSYEVSE
jgi:hypothetical protein